MFIYLAMFAASAMFLYLSRKIKNKNIRKLLVIIALLLPSLVAAFRATSVGTDYEVYGVNYFRLAKQSDNLIDYFTTMTLRGSTNYGIFLIVYISSLFSEECMLEMFLLQMITVVFIYLGLCKCEKKYGTPVWLAMLLYYLCLYNASLNIIKQCLAVAIAFYAFTFIWEKKYVLYALFTIVAYFMHTSAIIALAVLILYKFLNTEKYKKDWQQLLRGVTIVVLMVAAVLSLNKIVTILVNVGLLRSTFIEYLAGGTYSTLATEASFSISKLFIQMCYLAGYALYYRILGRRNKDPLFFTMTSLLVLIIDVFSPLYAKFLFRAAYYFVPFQMVGLSNIALVNKKASKQIWIILLILLAFVAWYRLIVMNLGHETIPYELYWN